ncbi:ABC transporter ATP-binding protein [Vibrio mimicus]|uniref:ABC transporter ATP-binding protein n=1 Tax=Vibrio mimicus TaxID=674 RepID=UPI002F94D5F7
MNKIQQIIIHSGAKTQRFWQGLLSKVVTESITLVIWLMLFLFLLYSDSPLFGWMLALAIGVIFIQWFVGQNTKQSFLGAYEITHHLRTQLLADIRRQPLATLRGKRLGEKIKLLTSDLKQFEDIFSHLLTEFISTWVIPCAMLLIVIFVQPLLGITLICTFTLALSCVVMMEKRFSHQSEHTHHANVESSSQLLEYIECLPTLRRFGQSHRLLDPLCEQIEAQRKAGLGLEWLGGIGVLMATFVLEIGVVAHLALSYWFIQHEMLTMAQCLVVIIAIVACIRPLTRMTVYAALLRYMFKAAERLHHLTQLPQQSSEGCKPSACNVSLKNIHLSLEGKPILNDINLDIAEGEHIALVGKSGSGKTSLLDVIAAFHIPTQGEVMMGQRSFDEIGTQEWYRHIAYVTQDVQLLGGSLRDNLLLAKPEATELELLDAIKAAGLSDLIAKLPEGMDSAVGENGNQLSGGERQRLSIARALLHDAPVLLLDEFTSALDTQTQSHVLKSIARLAQGKTVISVAHRLDTIQHVDKIYFIEEGRVVKSGTHEEMLKVHQGYQQLWYAGKMA